MESILILLLITPLLGALLVSLITLISKNEVLKKIVTGVSFTLSFFYLSLIHRMLSKGTVSYNIGGWDDPYAITLVVDELSFILLCVTSIIVMLSFIYSLQYFEREPDKLYFFFLFLTVGLNGLFLSGDIFNIYVFFELTVISSYILITFGEDRGALKASIEYLIIGTIASLFFLLGIGVVYAETGVLNIRSIAMQMETVSSQTQAVIFILFLAAVGIKAAIIPFHSWLVAAHSKAPTPFSAVLSGLIVKIGIYIFIRISSFGFTVPRLNGVLIIFGALTAVGGAIGAVLQWDIKRITAYSTISQMGIILVGIGSFSTLGVSGSIYHMVNHAFFKALLFLCAGAMIFRSGVNDIREQKIGTSMPITLIVYSIGLFAISGLTPLNGSVSKSLITTAVNNYPTVVFMLMFASAGTVAGFAKVFYYSFLKPLVKERESRGYDEAPVLMLLPMIVLAGFCLVLGLMPYVWLEQFFIPAASVVSDQDLVLPSFVGPVSLFKEWLIFGAGLFGLYCVIRLSKVIDPIRAKLSGITINKSIVLMLCALIVISIHLEIV